MTDEEKAQAVVDAVEKESKTQSDESKTTKEPTNAESTEEKNSEEEQTFTNENPKDFQKQFTNLKGESWEEYGSELEKAYTNSTSEALKLKKQLDDNAQLIEEAKKLINGKQPDPAVAAQFDINALPEIQMLRAEQQSKMVEAFDTFAKQYPQARESDSFEQFQKASNGASQAFTAAFNRVPTYPELFEKTAQLLGWQPSDKNARKDAAVKDATTAQSTTNSAPNPVPKTNVTQAQLDYARRFWPDKNDNELAKELSAVI